MNIVQISSSYSMSGGAKQALLLSIALMKRGHNVWFCAPEGGALYKNAMRSGLKVCAIEARGALRQWKASRVVRDLLRRSDIDVVHTHHTGGHNIGLMATFFGGAPVVVKRGVVFKIKSRYKFNTNRVRCIVALTGAIRDMLIRWGVKSDKVEVLRHIIHAPKLDEVRKRGCVIRRGLGIKEDSIVIGSVGNGRPEKGFDILLRAVRVLKERNVRVYAVFVGGGVDECVRLANALDLMDRVFFLGYRDDVLDLMASFDILAFAGSGMDSVPNVVLEAMSVGTPVVSSDIAGIEEPFGENLDCGCTFEKGNYVELADVIAGLVHDKEKRMVFGRNGLTRVVNLYGEERQVREAERIYRKAIGL